MRSFLKCLLSGVAMFAVASPLAALAQGSARAVPTYESVGLYWTGPLGATPTGGCEVRYRKSTDAAWSQGLPLWYDARNNECRGSLVHLTQDTSYQVEMNLPGAPVAQSLTFRTWPNRRPVARTVVVASGSATLNITDGGSPGGYVVYQGAPGATLDAANAVPYNVFINASYVIVRGLVLKNAQQDGIRISSTATDVIIEDNEITGWGRQRAGTWGVEHDSAVHALCTTPAMTRVTVQRNLIHEPRYGANSWSDGHPEGPQGVTFTQCGGNNVIRHNEIWSTPGHYYNDIIGGGNNDSNTGFPNADSDIYGNEISHSWDDAIEAEGGNRNVRIWGNYINETGTGIASLPNAVGPLYMFRNVYNRSRILEKVPRDQDERQVMFKAGSDPLFGDGRRYIFHNTTLQAREPGSVYGLGASGGISGNGTNKFVNNTVSRNNIFHNWRTWDAYFQIGVGNDFANDMYNGNPGAPSVNGINATPTYAPGNGWQSESGGQYALQPGTPGHDQGARIPNFNDNYVGAAPDVGAAEYGAGPMVFGVAASPGPAAPPPATVTDNPPRLANISTRGQVRTGNEVMIGGFIIGGAANKTVAIVATGPSLATAGIANPLANPTMTLVRSSDQSVIGSNDDWQTASNASQLQAAGFAPAHPLESAILVNLPPGAYTAIVSGVGGGTGVGLVAVYEVDRPDIPLINLSTRGLVLTGNDVMIGGFVIQGSGPQTVAVVATGPSLTSAGIANALPDPTLTLVRSADQSVIATNDNWQSASNAAQIQAAGFAPAHPLESAIMMTLAPGAYTAIVSGVGGGTGVGIIAVYATP
jgi:hypothetical protein